MPRKINPQPKHRYIFLTLPARCKRNHYELNIILKGEEINKKPNYEKHSDTGLHNCLSGFA
jgi:hypothetical protein